MINWRRIITDNGIEHIERGANVKRGEINIKCPLCGPADPSFHLGLNLDNGWWACWRNKMHRGKSPVRLLMALLRVPYWKARELAGLSADYVDPEGFTAVVARILGHAAVVEGPKSEARRFLQLPSDVIPISEKAPRSRRHYEYLAEDRGFGFFTRDLCDLYDLCAARGVWVDRVLIPYFIGGELVTWTARAIAESRIRYRDLAVDDCLVPPKETLYNYDCIAAGGKVLLICEGPVDALKLDFFGFGAGVRAVALSTNSMTDEQLYMLEEARDQFLWLGVMMDATPAGTAATTVMCDQLAHLNARSIPVPYQRKDAGALAPHQAIAFADRLTKESP